ncbi:hypothetical protein BDV96DRAFT_612320 [Lophiotrema nucula]|uniref:Uncharacterized protein n=1 Tax=Lophiotrema nucula TaxID=690887 RepID=A0A6A5ZA53_9PLEO|nr:hypothetical protein BDV96DRAFT_612320 [Lophiotrema nucula]
MQDPDRGWKPNGRPQSTMARNFLSELDDLFKIDGDLDTLDKTVHQKKQAVTTHTQELEALERRLRETEERLNKAKTSPSNRKDSQRRSPLEGTSRAEDKARLGEPASPLGEVQNRQRPVADTYAGRKIPGALPRTPTSYSSADYVLVDRPRTAQSQQSENKA